MVTINATDTVVHEAALAEGTGIDWLANNGSTTSDLTAGGTFTLNPTVTNVAISLGGQPTNLTLADLATNPTVVVGGETLRITSLGNGNYSYTFMLLSPKTHDTSAGKVGEIVHDDLQIVATGAGGKSTTATGAISIVNDEIAASSGALDVQLPHVAKGVSLVITLDKSSSMFDTKDGGMVTDPVTGLQRPGTRMEQAQQSLNAMLDAYAKSYPADTKFEISIIPFDRVVLSSVPVFTTIAEAKNYISTQITRETDASNLGGTYYEPALGLTQKVEQAALSAHPDWEHKVYFVTDGEPEAGHSVPAAWQSFVTGPNMGNVDVYAVGVGPGANTATAISALKTVVAPNDPDDSYIAVTNPQDLAKALQSTLSVASGNVLDSIGNAGIHHSIVAGADQGFSLVNVTVNGVNYVLGDQPVTVTIQPGVTMDLSKDGSYRLHSTVSDTNFTVPMTFQVTDADGDRQVITQLIHFGDFSAAATANDLTVDFQDQSLKQLDAGTYNIQGVNFTLGAKQAFADSATIHERYQGIVDGKPDAMTDMFTYQYQKYGTPATLLTSVPLQNLDAMRGLAVYTKDAGTILKVQLPNGKAATSVDFDLGDDDPTLQTFNFYDASGALIYTGSGTGGNGVIERLHFEMPDGKAFTTMTTSGGLIAGVTPAAADQLWFDNFVFHDVGLYGTAGDDTLHVSSPTFGLVNGGAGIDTLVLDGANMHVDLSSATSQVKGVEHIDLGAGGNTLVLKSSDVLTNGHLDPASGKTQMQINGQNGEVDLTGGTKGTTGWTNAGDVTVNNVHYQVYTTLNGTSELLVEDKVHVTIL